MSTYAHQWEKAPTGVTNRFVYLTLIIIGGEVGYQAWGARAMPAVPGARKRYDAHRVLWARKRYRSLGSHWTTYVVEYSLKMATRLWTLLLTRHIHAICCAVNLSYEPGRRKHPATQIVARWRQKKWPRGSSTLAERPEPMLWRNFATNPDTHSWEVSQTSARGKMGCMWVTQAATCRGDRPQTDCNGRTCWV